MVSGYVLILAVLILGGFIATLGDRIGMKVGKARLSLFNLRPRQTATLVSIATGSVISASTLALLFGVSSQLRTGVFELSEIQDDLEDAEANLRQTQAAKEQIESDLTDSMAQQTQAREQLQSINRSLQSAQERQRQTRTQLQSTRQQLEAISQQSQVLRNEIQLLQSEREALLGQQQRIAERISERDREIVERDREIAVREQQLRELAAQQQFLNEEVAELQQQYEGLFRGNIAIGRNEELISGLVRVNTQEQARQFVEQLLIEANRVAVRRIAPGTPINGFLLATDFQGLENLTEQLSDGQEYLVQVLSAANYVVGEPCVIEEERSCLQVIAYAVPNEIIYEPDTVLATTRLEGIEFEDRELLDRVNFLISATQFRARQQGVIGTTIRISDNSGETLRRFLQGVQSYGRPVTIQSIATAPIPTVGPIQMKLVAIDRGEIVLSTEVEELSPVPEESSGSEGDF